MKKRILTKALSVMLCGTAVAQTGLSVTTPIMTHAETPDENGVLITNPMQTVSFYDMFGDAIEPTEKMKSISYSIINKATSKSVKTGVAKYSENYKIDTSGLPTVDESGVAINYSVKLWMPDGIEKDEDKSTETHLAIKVEKRYSHRKVSLDLLQRNGVKLLMSSMTAHQHKFTIKLSPPESLANDARFTEKNIRVNANKFYTLADSDGIFETDRLGNPINYQVDINPTLNTTDDPYLISDLNKQYDKKQPSIQPDGTYILPYVRKNEKAVHRIWLRSNYEASPDVIDDIIIEVKEKNHGAPDMEFRTRDLKDRGGFSSAEIELPKYHESTDSIAKYDFRLKYLNSNYYTSISQNNLTDPWDIHELIHYLYVIKKINKITLNVLNYDRTFTERQPLLNKMPPTIKAKIKKGDKVLQEIDLTNRKSYDGSYSISENLMEYVGVIDDYKVPITEINTNFSENPYESEILPDYKLEIEPPEGYNVLIRDPFQYPTWLLGNKVTAYIQRKKVPLDKTIKLTFADGTEPPIGDITATMTYESTDPYMSWKTEKNKTLTFNQANNWTIKLDESLPLYDTDDEKIDYKIKFKRPAHYVISEPVVTDTLNTYTLTKGEPKLSGNISVKFEDYNGNKKTGNESYLPENVNISFVSRDGSQGNSNITLNKDSGYTYDVSTLPKEKPDGDDYEYVLTAPKITGYDNPVINGYEVTYKRTKETIGNSEAPLKAYFKKYDTTADDALTAKTIANPDVDSVTVRLKNGETVTLTKENGYTLNLAGKPKYDTNDNVIDYSVDTVDAPNGYELLKIEGNKDIVLRAIPEHYTTNVSANFKAYNDNAFTGNTKDNIEITIFRTTNAIDNNNFDGVTGEEVKKVTLTKDNGYTMQLTDLPKKNPDGEAYHYFIKTGDVTGFEKTYVKTETDGNLNLGVTHKRIKEFLGTDTKPVKAYFKKYDTTADDALTAKTIANPDVDSVTVRLKNGETVTLTKENGYTLNLTGKPKYDTNDNVIDYSVDTVDAPNGYEFLKIEGNKDIVLRAVPEHYTTTISTNFKSYNDNPFKGSTEDYIYVTVFRTTANITDNNFDEMTGEEVKKVMLSKSDGYSVTLTDLPKTNPDGEAYHYFIKMDNITGFEKTYTKNEADGNLTLGVTHKRTKLFTTRKVKIKFVNKDGSVIACNPIKKIKLTIYRNGDKLEEKDVTITNAETDIILTGLLYHEEESNYNGRLYNYGIVPSEEEGFNVVKDIVDDGFSSHIITYTSVKKLDTPCTDLTPPEPVDEPTPPKKEVIPWTDLVPANPIEPADPDPTVPNKDVIPWTDLVPATPVKPDTPSEPEKPSIPWTDLIPATPIIDNTQTIPVIPTVPDIITTPLIPVIQPVTETVATPAVISDSGIVAPVEPKVTTESGVQVIPDIPVTKDDTNNTGEKQEKPKHEPDEQIKTPNKTIGVNHETDPIGAAKIKKLRELQRKRELRERLNRTKIRKTLPRTGGTSIYYSMVPGSILLLSAVRMMLKNKKKK